LTKNLLSPLIAQAAMFVNNLNMETDKCKEKKKKKHTRGKKSESRPYPWIRMPPLYLSGWSGKWRAERENSHRFKTITGQNSGLPGSRG